MTNDPSDRRNEYREFDSELIASFLGDRTITRSERISTGKSNTNIKLELNDGITVVARLYSENSWSSPEREMLIATMMGGGKFQFLKCSRMVKAGQYSSS